MKKNNLLTTLALLMLLSPIAASAQSLSALQEKVSAVMQMDHRTDAELARDADRDPIAALEFIGLKDNMTVIEFLPADQAYYSKILGPVLVDNGHLMVIDSQATFDNWGDWTEMDMFKMTHQVAIENQYSSSAGRYIPGDIEFGVSSADMFLHFREYHNFNVEDNARINAKVFDTLKSGGTYVVVDHTRRHMQEETGATGRREDPVSVILQVQAAGFVLDRVSDMFFEASDDLTQEVGRIPNMTDRFFLVFKKP
ncbi:MAG: methyltransferase [SAR86 cluster bacterium]|uniref:Methyltransferase n=1 Tax=SAR86 cluster bacterium TaxID=2030880 RepID=A0A2A5AUX6_9GAMM|nr:MAG: methyltransferase [SAR86 cluster bacterium]